MTLPSSGAISLSQMRTEYGLSNPVSLSQMRGKPGAPGTSSSIAFSQMRGLSALTFSIAPGYYSYSTRTSAGFQINASQNVNWSYTRQFSRATVSGGGTSNYIAGSVSTPTNGPSVNDTVTVTATYSGQTYNWTFELSASGGQINTE